MLLKGGVVSGGSSGWGECARCSSGFGSFPRAWLARSTRRSGRLALLILNNQSTGSLAMALYQTYASDGTKLGPAVSREAFELHEVDVILVSPLRRYWDSRPDCPAIKFSERTASEPLSGKVVPEVIRCLMSLVVFKPLSFPIELRRPISLGLGVTYMSLSILR